MRDRILSAVRECKKFSFVLLLVLVLFLSSTAASCGCNGVGNCSCNGDGTCDGGFVPFTGQQALNAIPGASLVVTSPGMARVHLAHLNIPGVLISRDYSSREIRIEIHH